MITLVTPQFHREPGASAVACAPTDWAALPKMDKSALLELGCRPWDAPDEAGTVLMLFPGEWYHHIPAGMAVTDIFGEEESFAPGVSDDDIRFGCLAYGVRVKP